MGPNFPLTDSSQSSFGYEARHTCALWHVMPCVKCCILFKCHTFHREEQLRRADIKNGKYQIKVMFNDKEVSRTVPK